MKKLQKKTKYEKPKIIDLPIIGRISIGTGTVPFNSSPAISSKEMIESLRRASRHNFFSQRG